MDMIREEPQVTGLSPREGKEGTRVTIRGENLGKSKDDLKSNALERPNKLEYVLIHVGCLINFFS